MQQPGMQHPQLQRTSPAVGVGGVPQPQTNPQSVRYPLLLFSFIITIILSLLISQTLTEIIIINNEMID